ncbi:hypothetical protein LQ567_25520 [Niabella pedocola]|uniref:F5/8 type C domain-containing protein n=1 Tax=Niabella pedocola TaxID=1752077 RepID=A0ABS8PYP8_9BACT|nr:hypothetical protein [Niabella pedocola]MCD2426170.1 hypothetical protein [Niabella pedocola]
MKKIMVILLSGIIHISVQAQTGWGNIYGASGSGSAGAVSVDWVLGSLSTDGGSADIALPVQFGTISATIANQQLLVKWTTETESNNDHFDIEVSADGTSFKKVASVASKAAAGHSATPLEYEYRSAQAETALALAFGMLCCTGFLSKRKRWHYLPAVLILLAVAILSGCSKKHLEIAPTIPNQYLRIAQVDKDGIKTYSKVVKITGE